MQLNKDKRQSLARATAWFWISYNVGLTIAGAWAAAFARPIVGELNLLWIGLAVTLLGGVCALVMRRQGCEAIFMLSRLYIS